MTDSQQATGDTDPVQINAVGPRNVAPQQTVTRRYDNNSDAVDDKTAESLKAQTAPNPTTDVDLAREAYGADWNERRGHKIAQSDSGSPIYNHGGVAVDTAGHALGDSRDPAAAADELSSLENKPAATDADRYPVTAEAKQADAEKSKPQPRKATKATPAVLAKPDENDS